MMAKDLIKQLQTVHPNCSIVMPAHDVDDNDDVGGILVIDNDDDVATEATILNVEDHDKVFG